MNRETTDDDIASEPRAAGTAVHIAPLSALSHEILDAFRGRGQTVMHSWEWLQSAVEVYAPDQEASVYYVGAKDRPLALAPIYRTAGLARRYRLVGSIDTGETVDVMHTDGAVVTSLVKALLRISRPLDFGHFPKNALLTECIESLAKGKGVVVKRRLPMRAMPFLALANGSAYPEKAISKKRRGKLKRYRRTASKVGAVKTRVVIPTQSDVRALLDQFIAVEKNSWKGKMRTALAYDRVQAEFIERFCTMAAQRGMVRFCFLDVGDTVAAAQIAAVFDDRFWSIKIGYDERFAKFSPGELLLMDLVKYAVDEGLTHFEFCGKEAEWTRRWTSSAHEIVALRYYPFNAFGAIAVLEDGAALIWNRVKSTWRNRSFSRPQRV